METAARNLQFEKAAEIRDIIADIKEKGRITVENVSWEIKKHERRIKRR